MQILAKHPSRDGSIKYLWQTRDGLTVESIWFHFQQQEIICVSSQVGCNVGCPFCATGQQRNRRNLTVEEICAQVHMTLADLWRTGVLTHLDQVAFAGMGEPLLNFEAVSGAASLLREAGVCRAVSLSTSGVVPRMHELGESAITKLFISLHATTDALRNQLVPLNKKYPLASVLEAARAFFKQRQVPVTATYLLFGGINDSDEDLERLLWLLDPEIFVVQFSSWNPIAHVNFVRSERLEFFREQLAQAGFSVFVLQSKGVDVEGGCGQLRSRALLTGPNSRIQMPPLPLTRGETFGG